MNNNYSTPPVLMIIHVTSLLQGHLRRWVDVLLQASQTKAPRRGEVRQGSTWLLVLRGLCNVCVCVCVCARALLQEVTVCLLIMGMFHMLPASTFRLFEHLLTVCIKAEKAVSTEVSCRADEEHMHDCTLLVHIQLYMYIFCIVAWQSISGASAEVCYQVPLPDSGLLPLPAV